MVFEWVTSKFKERQLKKAQIQAEADHMVIVSGLSILNPTARTFFQDMPFYDLETDSVDFKKLEEYIYDLKHWKGKYTEKQCLECSFKENYECFKDAKYNFRSELREVQADYKTNNYSFGTCDFMEFENLRMLFMELTGKDEYYYTSDFNEALQSVKEYKEQYRNLDETISNFENKIYQKNKEIERLQKVADKCSSEETKIVEVPKIVYKESPKDNRPIKRESKIYRKFRLAVLKRDKVCQCCGSTENIHVHHLNSFKHYNSLGADPNNGIALCEDCHRQYHSIYGNSHHNNSVNFAKFMREYGNAMQVNLDYVIDDDDNNPATVLGGK